MMRKKGAESVADLVRLFTVKEHGAKNATKVCYPTKRSFDRISRVGIA